MAVRVTPPQKPQREPRDVQLRVNFTRSEYEHLQHLADEDGRSLSNYIWWFVVTNVAFPSSEAAA